MLMVKRLLSSLLQLLRLDYHLPGSLLALACLALESQEIRHQAPGAFGSTWLLKRVRRAERGPKADCHN